MSLSISFHKNKKNVCSLPEKRMTKVFCYKKETLRCIRLSGSLTLEAAVIVPCMLFFFVSILFFFRVMQVQLEVQAAADNTARKLAVYTAVGENTEKWEQKGVVFALFLKELSGNKYAKSYVRGGIANISLKGSDLSGREIKLNVNYSLKCPAKILGMHNVHIALTSVCRKWTGWEQAEKGDMTQDIWVYITETGLVYHKTQECTHLMLSIKSVAEYEVPQMRNEAGGRYKKCHLCAEKKNTANRVYITNQGDRYHYDLNCSGIKRTVSRISLSEVGTRKPCSRCRPAS